VKVSAWRTERRDGWLRISAQLAWEESARTETLWIEWPEAHAGLVRPTADAALLLGYPLAMSYGETRLSLDGEVSPRLAEGARVAMAVIARSEPTHREVRLEVREGFSEFEAPAPARVAGLCLSGGVDALAALQEVRALPPGHPARFAQGIFAFGFNSYDFVDGAPDPARVAAAEAYADRLEAFAEPLGVPVARVRTNYRTLHRSFEAWAEVAHDSHLAALGHLMRRRLRSLAIGSAGAGISDGIPQNPLLVALYATDDLDVHGAQPMRMRREKLRRLLGWPEALDVLRVCLLLRTPAPGARNCGRCEKCVRTVLQCLTLGERIPPGLRAAFSEWPDTPEAIAGVNVGGARVRAYYAGLAPLLVAQGRADLAAAINRGIATARGSH
jgi:hypothetical protein